MCHFLTILKSAKSYAHAMIAGLLPYLLWQFTDNANSQKIPLSLAGSSPLGRRHILGPRQGVCKKHQQLKALFGIQGHQCTLLGSGQNTPAPPKEMSPCWQGNFEQLSVDDQNGHKYQKGGQICSEALSFGRGSGSCPLQGSVDTHTVSSQTTSLSCQTGFGN